MKSIRSLFQKRNSTTNPAPAKAAASDVLARPEVTDDSRDEYATSKSTESFHIGSGQEYHKLDIDRNRKLGLYNIGTDSVDDFSPSSNDIDSPRGLGLSKVVEVNRFAPKTLKSPASIYHQALQHQGDTQQTGNVGGKATSDIATSTGSNPDPGHDMSRPPSRRVIIPPLPLPRALPSADGESLYSIAPGTGKESLSDVAPMSPSFERTQTSARPEGVFGFTECIVESTKACIVM